MSIESINPATDEVIETFEPFTEREVDETLQRARACFLNWRTTTFAERGALMRRVSAYLRSHAGELGHMITLEMGKPIAEAEAEIEKCAWACDFYAENAEKFLGDENTPSGATQSYVAYRPLGVVLAVMPWNYPFWQVFRFAAPAVMAGNVGVLKHASNVSQSALAIERVFRECDAPDGLFQTLLVPGAQVASIIADPRVAAVTITGSEPAGVSVATAAGAALKKSVLELGGSDAFIILEDADIPAAAQMAARARFQNTGQSCIAAKRFIVVEAVADAFEQAFVAAAKALVIGDPLDRATQVGPMARTDLRDALHQQVLATVEQGAHVALGGEPLDRPGAYYAPTILTGVTPAMTAFREETFGPVAAVIRARDTDEAVALANDSDFGLGGALWSRDLAVAQQLAARLESGAVFINGMTASDPRLPFGGVKHSGYGRELAAFGIREFVNIQTVWIGPATTAPTAVAAE